MSEKEFKKYLERLAVRLHKKTMEFYGTYPEYNITGDAEGYLSITLFKDRMNFGNSADAEKRISTFKERENGKWKTL